MIRLTYKKTGLTHYVKDFGSFKATLCSIELVNEKEEWTDDPNVSEGMCKRCRVAAGVPARLVYNYGPDAWK